MAKVLSRRWLIGNLAGLGLLAYVGSAASTPITFQIPTSVVRAFSFISFSKSYVGNNVPTFFGYIVAALPSSATASEAYAGLPSGSNYYQGGQYIPCEQTSATAASCWPTLTSSNPILISGVAFNVPEPSAIAVIVTGLAAMAFAVGRRRSRRAPPA